MSDDPILRSGAVRDRMKCSGQVAHNIAETFVTVKQLLEAIEDDDPLTDIGGIGPKTADVIMEWYGNRYEREENASNSTVKRTSQSSMNIHFHESWEPVLEGADS